MVRTVDQARVLLNREDLVQARKAKDSADVPVEVFEDHLVPGLV